jgi:hypothetical protein
MVPQVVALQVVACAWSAGAAQAERVTLVEPKDLF